MQSQDRTHNVSEGVHVIAKPLPRTQREFLVQTSTSIPQRRLTS